METRNNRLLILLIFSVLFTQIPRFKWAKLPKNVLISLLPSWIFEVAVLNYIWKHVYLMKFDTTDTIDCWNPSQKSEGTEVWILATRSQNNSVVLPDHGSFWLGLFDRSPPFLLFLIIKKWLYFKGFWRLFWILNGWILRKFLADLTKISWKIWLLS